MAKSNPITKWRIKSGGRDKPDVGSGSDQLRAERRVGAAGSASHPQRRLLQLLSRAVSGFDCHSQDSPEDALLHVQHRSALHDDVRADSARLLPSAGIGREDRARCHRPLGLLRLHAGHRRKDAGNVRIHSAHRSDSVYFSMFS